MTKKIFLIVGFTGIIYACEGEKHSEVIIENQTVHEIDTLTHQHLANDFPPYNADGSLNCLVEIPAGTIEKAEVDKSSGKLATELVDGEPRKVKYLPYPSNYGLIPQTLLPKNQGGDGDPLDVIILGEALEKGQFYSCNLIGVLHLLDGGEQDDKLIAVLIDGPFGHLNSIDELNTEFKGVTEILETWFENYKGTGRMESQGFGEKEIAEHVLAASIAAFK